MSRIRFPLCLLSAACSGAGDDTAWSPGDRVVQLRWLAGYDGDDWDRARAGLWWSLSNLGAVPPVDEAGLRVVDDWGEVVRFELDLSALGLPPDGEDALWDAALPLVASDEVTVYGGVDLGRFLLRTLYEPWHYYRIVGACPDLDDWTAAHLVDGPSGFAVTESLLVDGDRLVHFNQDPVEVGDIALVAAEGEGSLSQDTFHDRERETVDVMANGRQRFAVYDEAGLLQGASSPALSPAGQPGRCMWCHEDHLMSAAPSNGTVEPWLDVGSFNAAIEAMQALMVERRQSAPTAVDFEQAWAHTWAELLGETFLQPSVARVALEWQQDAGDVAALVAQEGLTLRESEEYPDFGPLLLRAEVDALHDGRVGGGYTSVPTLPSARELDPAEPPGGAGLAADDARATLARCAP